MDSTVAFDGSAGHRDCQIYSSKGHFNVIIYDFVTNNFMEQSLETFTHLASQEIPLLFMNPNGSLPYESSGSHGGEYGDGCLLGCCTM
jgi:hypothetical protein